MSEEPFVIDLSNEQLWSLENGKELRFFGDESKIKIRGENYYE